jgi:glycosyltransferase involved in cell wall biosynthesis
MRILLVNAKPTLADALAAHSDVDVELLWPRRHHFQDIPPPATIQPRFYGGGGKLSPSAIWHLRAIIQRIQPDVVHAFYGRALAHTVLAATAMRHRPKIVTFRGVSSPLSRLDAGDWLTYRHPLVDAHACESEAVRQALITSGMDADSCFVTFNCMHMQPTQRPGRAGLAQFGIPAGAFVVGTIAAMRRVKGIDILLQAAARCGKPHNIYWILFGQVIDPAIRVLADDLRIRDRVRLVGHRPDASELISGADVFVMPSRAEALCQALVEAMYQRVCPIVSSAGGMKEVVRHERDGLVFPVESVDGLALAIQLLHADRHRLEAYAASAHERVLESFSPDKMAERCLSIYCRLLGNQRSRNAA